MLRSASLPYGEFGSASRLRSCADQSGRLTVTELATLIGAGLLATAAIAFVQMQIRVPGRAILFATLPILLGVAIVPRRFSGTISGIAAAGTVGLLLALGVGHLQAAAVASLLAIGPAIDLALRSARTGGWRLYLRFAAAGMSANLLAFAVRWITAWLRLDANQPHVLPQIDTRVLISFAVCGFIAGIISAMICFRASSRPDQQ